MSQHLDGCCGCVKRSMASEPAPEHALAILSDRCRLRHGSDHGHRQPPLMDENRGLITAVFGAFAVFGVMTAAISAVVATQSDGGVQSVFRAAAVIAIILAVLTGYVALAARRKWWPLRESPVPSAGGYDSD